MLWILFEVLDLLFAIQHLPALDAQHFSVRFLFYVVEFPYEGLPFG